MRGAHSFGLEPRWAARRIAPRGVALRRVALRRVVLCGAVLATACGPGGAPDAGASIGEPCGEGTTCPTGLACIGDGRFAGGYCSAMCPDGTCPGDAACDDSYGPPLCLASCLVPSDCRDGYQCWRGSCRPLCADGIDCGGGTARCEADGRCVGPECEMDSDCAPSLGCVGGRCVPIVDGGGLDPGQPCTDDGDCASGICLDASLGGFCSALCTSGDDCFGFTVEAGCSAVPRDEDGDGSFESVSTHCVPYPIPSAGLAVPCARDDDCAARICHDGQCTEVCASDASCMRGQTCTSLVREGTTSATYSGCGYAPSSGVTVDEIAFDPLDLAAGFLGTMTFATPPNAVSVTLQAERTGGDPLDLTFTTVDDSLETRVFDISDIFALVDPPNRWVPGDNGVTISMLVPNTTPSRVEFVPGRYTWALSPIPRTDPDPGSANIRATALIKRTDSGRDEPGTIDLNLFFVGVSVNAANAPSDAKVQGALGRLASIFGAANIGIGRVRYFDITGRPELAIIDSADSADSELGQLFSLSAGRSGRAINVFLVRSFSIPGSTPIGIAGGVPGPVGIHGSPNSGVAASFDAGGANVLGHVIAHEIGHYLGLFHTVEQRRACGPGETPADDNCSAFGGVDPIGDTGTGTGNLMYWSIVGAGTNTATSNGQRRVMRLSALVGP